MITPERMADILEDAERAERYNSTTIRVTIPEVKSLLTLAKSALDALDHHKDMLDRMHTIKRINQSKGSLGEVERNELAIDYHRARIEAIKGEQG